MKKTEKRIEKLMLEHKLSLSELARRTDIPKTTLHRYLNDAGSIPANRLTIIADALLTTPGFLLGWEEEANHNLGDHEANLEHLKDKPELFEIYNDIYESENLQLLFDTSRDLTPQELEKVLNVIKIIHDED